MIIVFSNIRLTGKETNLISCTDVMSVADDGIYSVTKVNRCQEAKRILWSDLPISLCTDVKEPNPVRVKQRTKRIERARGEVIGSFKEERATLRDKLFSTRKCNRLYSTFDRGKVRVNRRNNREVRCYGVACIDACPYL